MEPFPGDELLEASESSVLFMHLLKLYSDYAEALWLERYYNAQPGDKWENIKEAKKMIRESAYKRYRADLEKFLTPRPPVERKKEESIFSIGCLCKRCKRE